MYVILKVFVILNKNEVHNEAIQKVDASQMDDPGLKAPYRALLTRVGVMMVSCIHVLDAWSVRISLNYVKA